MRKALSVILILTAILVLTACGGDAPAASTGPRAFSLNGTDISQYTIVYSDQEPDYNLHAAEYIRDRIQELTGNVLTVQTDGTDAAEHEILVGETTRPLSATLDAQTEGLEFAILADETSIALEGDYFVIAAAAYYFVDTYISGDKAQAEVPKAVAVSQPIIKTPNNYIMLIGDGMGVYQTQMFEYLEMPADATTDGENFFYGYMLPYEGKVQTKSNDSAITDSAAGGTALSSGYKTNNGYIGKDKDLKDVMSLTELAISLGKKTGVMSTEPVTGATPASFSAHVDNRGSTSDILTSQKLLPDTVIKTLYDSFNDSKNNKTIAQVLDQLNDGEKGFFLMYEEAYIDKHCHENDLAAAYKTMYRFNQAIGQFMEYAFYHPDTFVLITADHETGDLRPDETGALKYNSDDHTGSDVFVFVYGEGAQVFDGQVIENVQIPKTIAKMWGVEDFGDPASEYPALGD